MTTRPTSAHIVDTSALLAYFNSNEPRHADVSAVLESAPTGQLVVSPYVIAELDYLLATRLGVRAELAALEELASGAWDCATLGSPDLGDIASIIRRYDDQQIGIADASLVHLADRYGTRVVVTLDRRHFSILRPKSGGRFAVRP
jgi:uncharacterized protein